jgi:hypothetical protein
MNGSSPPEPHDWTKLSFGEFLRRTPTGLFFASTLGLLSAGWAGGTYFAKFQASGDKPQTKLSCPNPEVDTFFIIERKQVVSADRCITKVSKFFRDREGQPHTFGNKKVSSNLVVDDSRFFCFVGCDATTLQVVCNGQSATASRGVAESLIEEIKS